MAELQEPELLALEQLRQTIIETIGLGQYEEVISYQIPSYKYRKKFLVGFGAFKNHLSFFVMDKNLLKEKFANQLTDFTFENSTVHFTAQKQLPKEVIRQIVKEKMAMVDFALVKKK